MYPELVEGIRSYAVLLAVADVVGFAIAIHTGRRLGIGTRRLLFALAALTVVAFGGAKLFSLAQRGWAMGSFAAELGAGYRFPGAVAALALVLMTCRRFSPVPPAQMADAITPAFPFAMAITRVGCFLSGCCGGKLCELPWAVQFPAATQVWGAQHRAGLVDPGATLSLHVHPLQVYFGVFSLAVGIFILWFFPKRRYDGQVFLVFIAVQGIGKFMLESLRFVEMPEIRYASLVLGLTALGILGLKDRSRKENVCGLPHVPGARS